MLEVVVGVKKEQEEEKRAVSLGKGREFKRMVEVEEAGDDGCEEGGHRAKRRRVEEESEDVQDKDD